MSCRSSCEPSAQAHLRLPADRLDLNLLDGEQPSHAAILLFGAAPQRFLPTSEVKCLHFHVRASARIGNSEYQLLTGATEKTASRDLDDLVSKGVLERSGTTGRGTHYVLGPKGDIKGTKGTRAGSRSSGSKGAKKGT